MTIRKCRMRARAGCATLTYVATTLSLAFSQLPTPVFAAEPAGRPYRAPAVSEASPVFDYEAGRAYRWDGLYLGASAGYGWGQSDHSYDRNANHGTATNNPKGVLGAITAGYNWVVAPSLLVGLEGDLGLMNLSASDKVIFDGHIWKTQFGPMWATARARAGVIWGRMLLYGTAGVAIMGVDEIGIGDAAGQTAWNKSVRSGWVAGVGAEYAVSSRMTAKFEYLHMDFGSYAGLSENQEDYAFKNKIDMVRAGINIKF